MGQSYSNQLQLAKDMVQGLYDRQKELEYVIKALNDQIIVLKNTMMFEEDINKYEERVKFFERNMRDDVMVEMIKDIKYIKDQEEALGNVIKIKQ